MERTDRYGEHLEKKTVKTSLKVSIKTLPGISAKPQNTQSEKGKPNTVSPVYGRTPLLASKETDCKELQREMGYHFRRLRHKNCG